MEDLGVLVFVHIMKAHGGVEVELLKIKSNDFFRQNTTTYTIINILVWLHVSVLSYTILRPTLNSKEVLSVCAIHYGIPYVYRVCVKSIIQFFFFHSRTVRLDTIKGFYLPPDAQENYFKKNIKIYSKTAPTCFGASTIIRCTVRN